MIVITHSILKNNEFLKKMYFLYFSPHASHQKLIDKQNYGYHLLNFISHSNFTWTFSKKRLEAIGVLTISNQGTKGKQKNFKNWAKFLENIPINTKSSFASEMNIDNIRYCSITFKFNLSLLSCILLALKQIITIKSKIDIKFQLFNTN